MVLKRLQRLFGGDPEAEARESLERAHRKALERRREWEDECAELAEEIEAYRSYEDMADETDPECPIITKAGTSGRVARTDAASSYGPVGSSVSLGRGRPLISSVVSMRARRSVWSISTLLT